MKGPTADLRFNAAEADRVQGFYERVLRHTKGIYAGAPFILAPWQRDEIVRPLYGWQRYDSQYGLWVRKYSQAWIELGRGNGKSGLAAGMALEGLVADGEEGAEVYGAAEDRDQADVVFRFARRMVELSPVLSKRLRIIDSKKRIIDPKTDSFYQALPRDQLGEGSQGFAPHVVVFDEVHVQRGRELIDVLKKGMGKRVQPLFIMITTAGNDRLSPAAEEHDLSEKVLSGEEDLPHRFVFMRNTPKDADPWDEANWYHANPALGDFLSLQTLREEAAEARLQPTQENSFRQYRLCQWVSSTVRWLSSNLWDANGAMIVEQQLQGRECYGGLDLASTEDFTAWVLVFPRTDGIEGFDVLPRFWLPSAAVERRGPMRATLETWARQGFLRVTDGNVVDYAAVRADIHTDAERFVIREFSYDRWNAVQLVQELIDGGLVGWPMSQTTQAMNPASKELERLLGMGALNHGGHPVLRWMAGNAVARIDPQGNVKPDKVKSTEKIDGIVALTMAIGAATREGRAEASVYETRGFLFL